MTTISSATTVQCTPADLAAKKAQNDKIKDLETRMDARRAEIRQTAIGTSTTPDWMAIGGLVVGAAVLGFAGYKLLGANGMFGGMAIGAIGGGVGGRAWGLNIAEKRAGVGAAIDADTAIATMKTQLAEAQATLATLEERC